MRAVRVGPCRCGRPAIGLIDALAGFVGWRCLAAACAACAADRPCRTFAEFAACLSEPVGVDTNTEPGAYGGGLMMPSAVSAGAPPGPSSVVVLTAEIALVQARLDDLQARVARHYGDSGGVP